MTRGGAWAERRPRLRLLGRRRVQPTRRQTPRQPAEWSANYLIEGTHDWRRCKVINVSTSGAGVELFHADLALFEPQLGLQDHMVLIELQRKGSETSGIELRGTIRGA